MWGNRNVCIFLQTFCQDEMLNGLCTRLAQILVFISYAVCTVCSSVNRKHGVAVEEVWRDLAHVAGKTRICSSESDD